MAANSGAFGAKPGYNQSGGGYYVTVGAVPLASTLGLVTAGSGSGGAYAGPTLSTLTLTSTFSTFCGSTTAIAVGKVLRDMGKTVTSSNRTFRKFQLAVNTASTGGVNGNVPPQTNYAGDVGDLTFYLEVNRENGAGQPIARTFY